MKMPTDRAKPRVKVRLDGLGVTPESVRIGELAEILRNLEDAVVTAAKARGIDVSDVPISLVQIEEGSEGLLLAMAAPLLAVYGNMTSAIAAQDMSRLPRETHAAIAKISEQTVRTRWRVHFEADQYQQVSPAVLSPERPIPAPADEQSQHAVGSTVIYGRCVRVGGEDSAKAELRLLDGRMLRINVTEEQARKLASRLYEVVAIVGEATWETVEWHMVKFTAAEILPFRDCPPNEAFESLAEFGAAFWQGVDAREFVRKQRSP